MIESIDDIAKKYQGTFVFTTIKDREVLCKFMRCTEISAEIYTNTHGTIITDFQEFRDTIKGVFPEKGLYNIDGRAIHYTRIPARQYKRAPYKTNSQLYDFNNNTFLDISLENMEELYNSSYPKTLDHALDLLRNSIAINRSLGLSFRNNKYVLWYKRRPIAYISPSKKEIQNLDIHFKQEITDYLAGDTSWKIASQ